MTGATASRTAELVSFPQTGDVVRAVMENAPIGMALVDGGGSVVYANQSYADMLGYELGECIGLSIAELVDPLMADLARSQLSQLSRGETDRYRGERRYRRKDGSLFWGLVSASAVRGNGFVRNLIVQIVDIDRQKTVERRLADALANMADALVMFGRDDRLVMCNEQYRAMFPKTAGLRVPGAHFRDILRASIATGEQVVLAPGSEESFIEKTVASLHVIGDTHIELGDGRFLNWRVRPTADGGSLSVISDVSDIRRAQRQLAELNERLEALTRQDSLTGITNRRGFDETIDREYWRSARIRSPLSLFLVDIDRFTSFNDTYGHPAGDECLKAIANLLERTVRRPADVAARYGGEEFVAILPDTAEDGALELANSFRTAVHGLKIPHSGNPRQLVTVSIGVATFNGDHTRTSIADLLERADKALREAKDGGRDRVAAAARPNPKQSLGPWLI